MSGRATKPVADAVKPAGMMPDLNVNPCKMCMPMGSSMAAYGIEGCMTILHGSQGCATYIRRHMATHYNEPVDIASSALTEQGTVYGGEGNLSKGIDNLIKLYHPKVINISTTCLAETIGEDVPAMIVRWYEAHPGENVVLVPTSSPGYGGSQFEGYFSFLHALVSTVEMKPETAAPHQLNIVCGPASPADMRFLNRLIDAFGIDAVVLPDISTSLDRGYLPVYNRTPEGGTPLAAVQSMAGSKLTIELGTFASEGISVGGYLRDCCGVPCRRMNLPIALRDIDALVEALSDFSGNPVPDSIGEERGRYLDAMIDSHKYDSEGRACIFGEPDFCYAVSRLCLENGIVPVVVAAGSRCPDFTERIGEEVREVASRFLVDRFDVVESADFGDIERLAIQNGANVMIGSSDGRRISGKYGIPLVRCAFPIHDQMGGQRVRTMGYEGSLTLLDRITNAILLRKVEGFRAAIRDEFYDNTLLSHAHLHRETQSEQLFAEAESCLSQGAAGTDALLRASSVPAASASADARDSVDRKTERHPCFSSGCSATRARIHLAVAPRCNISCNYCVRRYDCPNESRPGVASRVLTPLQAFDRWKEAREQLENLTTVGIAGPGDALANWDETHETIDLIHAVDPDTVFCLSTNGLLLPRYADDLAAAGVTHVTVTMNAVDPAIGALIYGSMVLDGIRYDGQAAAGVLLSNQIAGIERLIALGVVVKVNTVLIEGVNDLHVDDVAEKAAALGASVHNIMQMIPVEGSAFGDKPQISLVKLEAVRKRCTAYLPQMSHCQQCRADAVGTLYENISHLFDKEEDAPEEPCAAPGSPTPCYRFAVATKSGFMVDEHFGHARRFAICESDGSSVRILEERDIEGYCKGDEVCRDDLSQEQRFERIVALIDDCDALLCLRIGTAPASRLHERGIDTVLTCDRIEPAVLSASRALGEAGVHPVLAEAQSA
jgi:nitrogenase molybdenum-iron protein alpha/beta subunit/MoaA/NifB/PqqE/SkfB family radical SAM enzyme